MNRIFNPCNKKIHEKNSLKKTTVRKSCYSKKRRTINNNNTLIQIQQPKIVKNNNNEINPSLSAYENHRHVIIGPSDAGKIYYMLKLLKK